MELQAGPEGTAMQFYRRHQMVVVAIAVSVAGIATGTAAAFGLSQALIFRNALLLSAGSGLALVALYGLLRHWGFAALTVLSPLPGLIWAAPLASGSDFGSVPFFAYGLGLALATLYSDYRLTRLLRPLLSTADNRVGRPLLPSVVTVGLIAIVALLWLPRDAAWQIAADCVLALAALALFLPLGLSLLDFDEAFVARANRARERRERYLEGLTFVAIPRWGLSVSGITVVLIVLGWHGAHSILQENMLLRSAVAVALVIAGALVAGGWREGLAFAGAVGTACLLTLWASHIAQPPNGSGLLVLQSAGLAAGLALWGLWRVRRLRGRRETARSARERVLADSGGAVFAVIAAAAALSPFLLLQTLAVGFLGVGFAGAAGILLAPALATGIETLIPCRASVEDLYSRRR